MSKTSNLELKFEIYSRELRVQPVREYVFALPRKWRFDFAWPHEKVAVEIEGGIFVNGAHNRGRHFMSDCDKYNQAALLGWAVLRYTGEHLKDMQWVLSQVKELLESRASRG